MKRIITVLAAFVLLTAGASAPAAAIMEKPAATGTAVTPDGKTVKVSTHPPKGMPTKPSGTPVKGMPGVTGVSARAACPVSICYLYNGGRQDVAGTLGGVRYGVSSLVKVGGHQGALNGATDFHTLGEISAHGTAGPGGGNVVEVGWTVSPAVNGGSYKPHLFVGAWVNGTFVGYNAVGGFVFALGAVNVPGGTQYTAGQNVTMQILYSTTTGGSSGWWIGINDGVNPAEWIGYYPDSVWTGASVPQTFTDLNFVQLFGEIASTETTPCSDMGLGTVGSNAGAARFGSTTYYNASGVGSGTGVNLNTFRYPTVEAGSPYANTFGEGPAGSQRAFRYGGPMWNAAGTGVGTVGQPC